MLADDVKPDRITAAKEAARDFVSSLPPKLTIGLVSFATEVELLEEPRADRGRVLEAIDGLAAGGGTAMGDALVLGVHAVRPGRDSIVEGIPASVLLISYGATTVGVTHPLTPPTRRCGWRCPSTPSPSGR